MRDKDLPLGKGMKLQSFLTLGLIEFCCLCGIIVWGLFSSICGVVEGSDIEGLLGGWRVLLRSKAWLSELPISISKVLALSQVVSVFIDLLVGLEHLLPLLSREIKGALAELLCLCLRLRSFGTSTGLGRGQHVELELLGGALLLVRLNDLWVHERLLLRVLVAHALWHRARLSRLVVRH